MPPIQKSVKPVKPKKPAVLATTPRLNRVAKGKAIATIRVATVPKPKTPRVPATSRAPPGHTLPSISHQASESPPGGESSEPDESSDDRGILMEDIQKMIQGSITEALAARDGKEKELGNFATSLPTAPVARGYFAGTGTVPPPSPSFTSPPALPQNVLSRWHWVSEDIIKNIEIGKFDIENLPKLHRSDELRNAYLKRSMKGIYQPLDGGPAEIVVGTSKLHSSFREPTTFFLAWQIYISIRAEFKPAMGSRLAYWTERLHYLIQLNYPWPDILEYIIAYFQTYQDRTDPVAWFKPDSTLISYHLTLVQQKPTAQPAPVPAAPAGATPPRNTRASLRPNPTARKLEAMAIEICMTYNRDSGCTWKDGKCPRRHVCGLCISSQHSAVTCPMKGKSQK